KAPYMTLTGTSMAAPVVSGTVALMLQANPKLTPNLVKAILMYTAEVYRGFRPLEQGAGFLNSLGAVRLARFYKTARKGARVPVEPIWSKQFFWGNHRITGGIMVPDANAWDRKIVWGAVKTLGDDGDNIVWGTALRGRSWRKTPLLSPSLSFEWFLDPRNDGAWIMQEFGDALMVRGAKP